MAPCSPAAACSRWRSFWRCWPSWRWPRRGCDERRALRLSRAVGDGVFQRGRDSLGDVSERRRMRQARPDPGGRPDRVGDRDPAAGAVLPPARRGIRAPRGHGGAADRDVRAGADDGSRLVTARRASAWGWAAWLIWLAVTQW